MVVRSEHSTPPAETSSHKVVRPCVVFDSRANAPWKRSDRMSKFRIGEEVWVSATKLSGAQQFALVKRKVLGTKQGGRSVVIDDRDGRSVEVSSRLVHGSDLGFLLLRVGDLESEMTLLDPLSKSILQFLRLLVKEDLVRLLEVRTSQEIECYMNSDGAAYTHVILVGHGRSNALKLAFGEWLDVSDFVKMMSTGGKDRVIISLACDTGKTTFGKTMSGNTNVKEFVAPKGAVHGASASLFVQQLLSLHLLEGREFETATRNASTGVPGGGFVHWRNGKKGVTRRRGRPKA